MDVDCKHQISYGSLQKKQKQKILYKAILFDIQDLFRQFYMLFVYIVYVCMHS